jgi:hypothetical protein
LRLNTKLLETNQLDSEDDAFCVGCAMTFITPVTETNGVYGPTLVVIAAALATQYVTKLSIAPQIIILGFAGRLLNTPRSCLVYIRN